MYVEHAICQDSRQWDFASEAIERYLQLDRPRRESADTKISIILSHDIYDGLIKLE